jgi:hypothetical protein
MSRPTMPLIVLIQARNSGIAAELVRYGVSMWGGSAGDFRVLSAASPGLLPRTAAYERFEADSRIAISLSI